MLDKYITSKTFISFLFLVFSYFAVFFFCRPSFFSNSVFLGVGVRGHVQMYNNFTIGKVVVGVKFICHIIDSLVICVLVLIMLVQRRFEITNSIAGAGLSLFVIIFYLFLVFKDLLGDHIIKQ